MEHCWLLGSIEELNMDIIHSHGHRCQSPAGSSCCTGRCSTEPWPQSWRWSGRSTTGSRCQGRRTGDLIIDAKGNPLWIYVDIRI